MTTVEVVGEVEQEASYSDSDSSEDSASLGIGPMDASVSLGYQRNKVRSTSMRLRRSGVERHQVLFGPLGRAMQRFTDALDGKNLWVFLDEWSSVPMELQPLLAELLTRSLFPVRGVSVKIAAIERRSQFSYPRPDGGYIGLEVGADAAAGVNLDDYLAFDHADDRATKFFGELLWRHAAAYTDAALDTPKLAASATSFTQRAFKSNAYPEFVGPLRVSHVMQSISLRPPPSSQTMVA